MGSDGSRGRFSSSFSVHKLSSFCPDSVWNISLKIFKLISSVVETDDELASSLAPNDEELSSVSHSLSNLRELGLQLRSSSMSLTGDNLLSSLKSIRSSSSQGGDKGPKDSLDIVERVNPKSEILIQIFMICKRLIEVNNNIQKYRLRGKILPISRKKSIFLRGKKAF